MNDAVINTFEDDNLSPSLVL